MAALSLGALAGGALASAASSAAGGIIGSIASSGDREKAAQAYAEAMAEIEAIGADTSLQQEIILEKMKLAGVYSPQLEETIRMGVSEAAQLQEDPTGRQAQLKALSQLSGLSETGLGPQERAAFNEMAEQSAQLQRSRDEAILQNMAQKGQAGSGAELAMRIAGSQSAANQEQAAADRMAASAADRALNALSQYGNLGGTVRSADYTAAQNRATAADELNRFNVQNQREVQTRNVAAQNLAQAKNLDAQQAVMDENVRLANAQKSANLARQRQQYVDKATQAERVAGAKLGQSEQSNKAADRTAQAWQGAGSAIGAGIGEIANASATDKLLARLAKKDEEDNTELLGGKIKLGMK